MLPKERVRLTFQHQVTDRVPINYLALPEVDGKLMKYFQTSDREELLQILGVDFRWVGPKYMGPELQLPDGKHRDIWGVIFEKVPYPGGTYDEVCYRPFANFKDLNDLRNYSWPKVDWYDFNSITVQCQLYKDYCLIAGDASVMDLINSTAFGRGMEKVLLDLAEGNPVIEALFDKRVEFYLEYAERMLQAGNGQIDILHIGDDYGTQRGLLLSPSMWRKYFRPRLAKFVDLGKCYNCKVMLHSCGSIRQILPDLIEVGVDIIDTIQTNAFGMSPEELKVSFGDKLCFHGAVNVQELLPYASPREVEREVKYLIDTLGEGGGYAMAPSHTMQPDIPLENILVMYETARNYRASV